MPTDALNGAMLSFARTLKSTEAVRRFIETRHRFESDEDLCRIREAFSQAARTFREKQQAGTLAEMDVKQVRELQSSLSLHPRTVEYLLAQQEIAELMQECNQQLSELLGFDCSSIAIPAGSC